MHQARHRAELELKLIMRRMLASALCAALAASSMRTGADETPTSQPPATAAKAPAGAAHDASGPRAQVSPVAITAKRIHPRLDLRLSSDRLHRVLDEAGVEPVPESDAAVDTVEVTAHHVQQEPITQGIPALYYGITHPTEAWRIFAPIQP